ncbi:MAG: hypothetical protein PHP32_05980 [Candidatus Izemoplasmatales bacterium]|nr:hypothetical protein [Candidatus Izemoplasmatales bacterium]
MFWVIFPKKKFILMVLIIITVVGLGFAANWALDYFSIEAQYDRVYGDLLAQYTALKSEDDVAMRIEIIFSYRNAEENVTTQSNTTMEYLLDETYFQRKSTFVNYQGEIVESTQIMDLRNNPYFIERSDCTGERSTFRFITDPYFLDNRFAYIDTEVPFGIDTTRFQSLQVYRDQVSRVWHRGDVYSFQQDSDRSLYVKYPNYTVTTNYDEDFDAIVLYVFYYLDSYKVSSYEEMQLNYTFNENGSMTVYYHFTNANENLNELELEMTFTYLSEPIDEIQISLADTNMTSGFPTREIAEKFVMSSADDITIDIGYGYDWMTVYFEEAQIIDFPIGYPWSIYGVDGNYNMVNERIVVDAGSTLTFHVNIEESDESFVLHSPFFLD